MRLLPFVVALVGCAPAAVPTAARQPAPVPVDVGWRTMVRDRATLNAYVGRLVRLRIDRADCVVEGKTIRAWYGDRNVPATLIVHCTEPVAGDGPYSVVGTCSPPVADGTKRGARIDYYVEVTGARVVTAP